MSENKQGETPVKSKRRSLYYILLSACALIVAAAITLTVVFFPQPGESDLENTDPPVEQPDDNDDDEDKDDDEEPSSTEIVFSLPVSGATVALDLRGVEPLSESPSIAASPITVGHLCDPQNQVCLRCSLCRTMTDNLPVLVAS